MGMFSGCRRDGYYVSYGSSRSHPRRYICVREPDPVYTTAPEGRVATTVRQVCASCGRFRSAKWEAAHPLLPGMAATPGLCGRCKREETSSEEKKPKCCKKSKCCKRSKCCCKKQRHHHSRRCTDSTDDNYYPIRDRRSPRRYTSDSRDYARHRASSRDNVRIVIANQPGERVRRPSIRSSSADGIRVIRRTSVVEVPERRRSRVRARSSSYAHYLDDELDGCVEKLVHPRHRSRSRSVSRTSYVEELAPRRSRHKRKSSASHVQFVDDSDEPVIVSGPARRISRRRAVYFDGAASTEPSKDEGRGRPRSRSSHHSSHNLETPILPTEDAGRSKSPAIGNSQEAVIPHPRRNSKPNMSSPVHRQPDMINDNGEATGYVELHDRRPVRSNTYSDPNTTPRPSYRHVTIRERADTAPELGGIKRPHSDTASFRSNQGSPGASQDQNTEHTTYQPKTPSSKRRRRYRDDSTRDDSISAGYRHVRAPSPSPPSLHDQTDYLTQMLQSSHITPPNEQRSRRQQYVNGPASPPSTRSVSRSDSNSAYRAPSYRNIAAGGTEHGAPTYQYSPTEPAVDAHGNVMDDYDLANASNQYNVYSNYPCPQPTANAYELHEGDWQNQHNAYQNYESDWPQPTAKAYERYESDWPNQHNTYQNYESDWPQPTANAYESHESDWPNQHNTYQNYESDWPQPTAPTALRG